ncbi:DUF3052 family protein [Qipengyuania sphaerica]|uniref:DUF3052 family protein n=1 Tax=Qipengyuania sphaerica TaxID=2867243 RepID=UPI001C884D15|nr:DUF3052 family protein [Qipengyuania sphaerica]MBX7540408.1 DUF3052 domain-containing protein [Qipengyuania sphaerica]
MTAGYSGTPLAKKLSLRDGQRVWFDGMPENVIDEIDEYALELTFVDGPEDAPDAAHIFVTERAALTDKLAVLRENIAQDGHVWVSWPKQASGIDTEVGEHDVREAGLAIGFVDTKKCAVDEVWSGLKFAIRKELRA